MAGRQNCRTAVVLSLTGSHTLSGADAAQAKSGACDISQQGVIPTHEQVGICG